MYRVGGQRQEALEPVSLTLSVGIPALGSRAGSSMSGRGIIPSQAPRELSAAKVRSPWERPCSSWLATMTVSSPTHPFYSVRKASP